MGDYRNFHKKSTRGRGNGKVNNNNYNNNNSNNNSNISNNSNNSNNNNNNNNNNHQANSYRFNNNSRFLFREPFPISSPSIDPRRFPPGARGQPAYGQPTTIPPFPNMPLSSPNHLPPFRFNNTSNTTASSANRYAGALREFSNQLPVRMPGRFPYNGPPPPRYGPPIIFPIWSKNKMKPLPVTSSNRNNNNNNKNNNSNINNDNSSTDVSPINKLKEFSFKKTTRSLDDLKNDDWNCYVSTSEEDNKWEKPPNAQSKEWNSYLNHNDLTDDKNKINANLSFLKQKYSNNNDEYSLVDYDDQICACVANPTYFRATRKLLELLYDVSLDDYIDNRRYSDIELNASKFNQNLFNFIEINKNLKNIFITTDDDDAFLLKNNQKLDESQTMEISENNDTMFNDVLVVLQKLINLVASN